MWHKRCDHCQRPQLFGVRRVIGLESIDRGVIKTIWSCPGCGGTNSFITGRSVAA